MMARAMTAARKAALRKAQLASARKRKGTGRGRLSPRTKRNIKRVAVGAAVVGVGMASVAMKNPGVYKRRVNKAKAVHYKNRQTKTLAKAQHKQRVTINSNAIAFNKYKRANPTRFKQHQPFGRPR